MEMIPEPFEEVIESIEDFAKSSAKKAASPKKSTAKKPSSPKKGAAAIKAPSSPKKGAAAPPAAPAVKAPAGPGPVAPPVVKAEVGKVVAYHADKNQPVPAPKQIVITATFNPVFITAQNKRMMTTFTPETTTFTPEMTTFTPEMTTLTPETTTPIPIMMEQTTTTTVPSDYLQYVTYAPTTQMPSMI
jgi:hypothetical protein